MAEQKEVVIRKVDSDIYRKLKQAAVEEDITMGYAITEAIIQWLEIRERKAKLDSTKLLKLNGIVTAGKRVRWSEQVDKIVYG